MHRQSLHRCYNTMVTQHYKTPPAKLDVYRETFKTLSPMNAMTRSNFATLMREVQLINVPSGRTLFSEGDRDGRTVYLLKGTIALSSAAGGVSELTAGSMESRNPLAPKQPRPQSAVSRTEVTILHVDSELFDVLLTWDQSSGYEVNDIEEAADGDWMTRLLTSKALARIPATNIQALFMKVENMKVRAGQQIISQGDEGDYYYIISEGRCQVSRRSSKQPEPQILAELSAGDSFGEEALISDAKRNADITMLSDGALMRLAKSDFVELLKGPMVNWLSREQADAMIIKGAKWLDVRLPSEHQAGHIDASLNIPLVYLRRKCQGLDPATLYIVYCDTGRRSSSAAFLLHERGFDVYVLKGGLSDPASADAA